LISEIGEDEWNSLSDKVKKILMKRALKEKEYIAKISKQKEARKQHDKERHLTREHFNNLQSGPMYFP
jgi:hypothetical protein